MHFLLLITAILTIGFTILVSVPGSPYLIGGMTQADISNMFSTAITPVGITFAIWSLVYISWILVGLMLSWLASQGDSKKYFHGLRGYLIDADTSQKTTIAFSLAIVLTAVWLIPWGNLYIGTALLIMWWILALLIFVFSQTRKSNVIVRSTIDLTFAWIIMALALNITVWIRYMWWPIGTPGDFYYAIFALGAILLIVSELQCRYNTYIISWVYIWTLLGIYLAHPILEERVAIGIYIGVTIIYIIKSRIRRK